MLTRFLKERFLQQDAEVMMEVVNSITKVEILNRQHLASQAFQQSLPEVTKHILSLPDVVRANVFDTQMNVIWSNAPSLIGVNANGNEDLRQALAGKLTFNSGKVGAEDAVLRPEQAQLGHTHMQFVENYLPVYGVDRSSILGVVEIYKIPSSLFSTIGEGQRLIWMVASTSGLFLFLSLFWTVRQADRVMRTQHDQLIDSETLAALGEMASAVAHGIRNPLASIRSSAEVWKELQPDNSDFGHDIISEVDRLERWVRDLLTYSQQTEYQLGPVDIREVLQDCQQHLNNGLSQSIVRSLHVSLSPNFPRALGDSVLLSQALGNIINNALEASGGNGEVIVQGVVTSDRRKVKIYVIDHGQGIAAQHLSRVCDPFFTTKKNGLGVGLAIARRIIRRFGGFLEVHSSREKGTRVIVTLQAMQ